jgi:hypothetical protein
MVIIGSVPNPHGWEHWPQAEAFLEPARKLGGFETVIEPDEALWVAMDDGELLGCATAWLGEGFVEVKLVGGRDHRRWIAELDSMIGAAAREAGATRLQAFGRRGWVKILRALGWAVIGEVDGMTIYHRNLRG